MEKPDVLGFVTKQTPRRRVELFFELLWGFLYYRKFDQKHLVFSGRGVRIKKVNGQIRLGSAVALGAQMDITVMSRDPMRKAVLEVGTRTRILPRTHITCLDRITIGEDCAISWDVEILDTDDHAVLDPERRPRANTSPVTIEDRVWIGTRSIILKGVTIGHDSIVGAGSVVTRSIPPYSLSAGNPARVIRRVAGWVR